VSSATATLVAQARGRGDRREVAEIAWGSVGLVTLMGLAFGAVAILGADVIVHHLLGAKGLVRELADVRHGRRESHRPVDLVFAARFISLSRSNIQYQRWFTAWRARVSP
jgi:hypothetical protein